MAKKKGKTKKIENRGIPLRKPPIEAIKKEKPTKAQDKPKKDKDDD